MKRPTSKDRPLTRRQVANRLIRDCEVMYCRLDKMLARSSAMTDDIEEFITEIGDELIVMRALFKKEWLNRER